MLQSKKTNGPGIAFNIVPKTIWYYCVEIPWESWGHPNLSKRNKYLEDKYDAPGQKKILLSSQNVYLIKMLENVI